MMDATAMSGMETVPMPQAPQGLMDVIFGHGDIVLMGTFLFLLAMSVLSWTTIVYRIWMLIRQRKHYHAQRETFLKTDEPIDVLIAKLEGESAVKTFLVVAQEALVDFSRFNTTRVKLSLSDYLTRQLRHSLDSLVHRLDGGLTLLATIGATAPFVGLFGTVWGIYHALLNISQMGSVNIATIAGPIGEALIATAVGLFVAIPAVLAYNAFNRQNRVYTRALDSLVHDVYTYALSQASKE